MKNDAGKYDSYSDGGLPNGPYQEPVKGASAGNALSELPSGALARDIKDAIRELGGEKFPDLMAAVDSLAALASQSTPVAQPVGKTYADFLLDEFGPLRGQDKYTFNISHVANAFRAGQAAAPTAAQGLSDAEIDAVIAATGAPNALWWESNPQGYEKVRQRVRALLSANRAAQETK